MMCSGSIAAGSTTRAPSSSAIVCATFAVFPCELDRHTTIEFTPQIHASRP